MRNNSFKTILIIFLLFAFLIAGFAFLTFSEKDERSINALNARNQVGAQDINTQNNEEVNNVESIENDVQVQMQSVLIVNQDIQAGKKLERSMFKEEKRPSDIVPSDYVSSLSQLDNKYAKINLKAGNPVTINDIMERRPINTITANIPEGYRAVTINVNVTSSVEGWARAGAHVDIVWNTRINDKPSAVVIIQNVKILSAERQIEANPEAGQVAVPSTVTLLVLAEDATKIHLAESTGKLSLQLRGDNQDSSLQKSNMLTIDDLLEKQSKDKNKKYSAVIKIKDKNGKNQKWGLEDGGNLVPIK